MTLGKVKIHTVPYSLFNAIKLSSKKGFEHLWAKRWWWNFLSII